MSIIEVKLEEMGSTTEATITKWHKTIGMLVEKDETLYDISTDKVEIEVPSPITGKIVALFFQEGDLVKVGEVVAHIEA